MIMLTEQKTQQRERLASELASHCPDLDTTQVIDSLSAGLTLLRHLLLTRIHEDVQQHIGVDSMRAPGSRLEEQKQAQSAKTEIEIYSNMVVSEEVAQGGYVDQPQPWFSDWLFRLRLGSEQEALFRSRTLAYDCPSAEARRREFLAFLERSVPEAVRTPLVLFRLFPRALRIVAAVAFGDPLRAQELRGEQCSFLPAIVDCFECHGRVLDNEDSCPSCGNPVWEFPWLQAD
jgi:hypothetical protein